MEIKTISDLRTFIEAIPEDQWTVDFLQEPNTTKRCVLGHLNHHLTGNALLTTETDGTFNLIDKLNIDWRQLVDANNGENIVTHNREERLIGIKKRVLHYLDEILQVA